MATEYTYLCPLPQLRLDDPQVRFDFQPGLSIRSISLAEQRALINAAKDSRRCSDCLISSLHDATVLISKQAPWPDLLRTVYYQLPFEMLVRRFLECFLLTDEFQRRYYYPPVIGCGTFLLPGSPDAMDFVRAVPKEPDWRPDGFADQVRTTDIRFDAAPIQNDLKTCWKNLVRLSGIDTLDRCVDLDNEENVSRYVAAGNENTKQHAQEITEAYANEHADEIPERENPLQIVISGKSSSEWFLKGFGDALLKDVNTWEAKRRETTSKLRLQRAFQIFVDAARMEEPHRFVNLITTLESLLSTATSELRFQLATRAAWLMVPADKPIWMKSSFPEDKLHDLQAAWRTGSPTQRLEEYDNISKMYDLRSKIVHGDKFEFNQLIEKSSDLSFTVKSVFRHIIENQTLFEMFMETNEDNLKAYLKALPLKG